VVIVLLTNIIGSLAVPQLCGWFTLRVVVILGFVHRTAAVFSIRPGSSPDRSNSAIFSRISRRDRHMKEVISSTGSFSLMQLARSKRSICDHFLPVFMSARFSRCSFIRVFPDFFVIQPNASHALWSKLTVCVLIRVLALRPPITVQAEPS
jgi:hypothetical protein